MTSISLLTQVGDLSDANKLAALPPRGGSLRAHSRSLPRLETWVMRIKVPIHHPEEVACDSISLLTQVRDLGDANKVTGSPPLEGGL